MNSLSLLIYFIHVLPAISDVIMGFGCTIILLWFIYGLFSPDRDGDIPLPFSGWIERGPDRIWIPVIGIFLIFLSSFIPNKETLYLIAASEIGESTVTSEYGQDVLSDIKEIIQLQLEDLKQ